MYTLPNFNVRAKSGNDLAASFKLSFHRSCGVTYFIFTDKRGGAGWKKACESPASYSGSVVYVGEQGGVWRGESLGGVCYQGTEPNSWLILELLERKSRGLTFPAVFLFLQKIVLEIHVWKEMQHVFNFVPSGMHLKVIFTGLVYRILYTQKKKTRYQYQYCLKAPISNFYCPDIV